jgi:hypothetical protein
MDVFFFFFRRVQQLSLLAKEVTRVSLEVGTEGILGGQAFVPEVQGMWKVCLCLFKNL